MTSPAKLYIVISCYNEQDVLVQTAEAVSLKIDSMIGDKLISENSCIVLVNDGSSDNTWDIIRSLHERDPMRFSGISLAHNSGHQNALLAGLMTVRQLCDITITMDADMQDDVNAIPEMVAGYYKGNDVVYGVRNSRDNDTLFKRMTAESYYRLMRSMGVDLVYNHADFRLMSSRVLNALSDYPEVNIFLRGIVPQIGFQSAEVYYERHERAAGKANILSQKCFRLPWKVLLHSASSPCC